MACITHASGTNGSTYFTPVSSAIANIGTSTSLGYTIAFVVLPTVSGGCDFGGTTNNGLTNFYALLGVDTSGLLGDDDSTANTITPSPALNSTDWFYIVLTYPGGANNTTPIRFHWKDLTTAGNWTHTNGGNCHLVGSGSTSNLWIVGTQSSSGGDWGNRACTYGLSAGWGTVALSDAQVEALSPNAVSTSKTSDAWNSAAGHPDLLIECTSTGYKTDIGANPSTYSTDANWTLTGANPTGWTFDGTGASTDLNVYRIN